MGRSSCGTRRLNAGGWAVADNRADEVIAAFLEEAAAGNEPDREELLARHPDVADELRSFLIEHDRLKAAAGRIQAAPSPVLTTGLNGAAAPGATARSFSDYEILEEVARGGMGVVYKARQVSLGRIVALKMILAGPLASPADIQRFRVEAEAVPSQDHPNIRPA